MDKYIGLFTVKFLFPCVMFSKFTASYLAYFSTDLGSEAFELPFPYWYAIDGNIIDIYDCFKEWFGITI